MKLGFVISHYPNEKRVPLLPEDIKDFKNEIVVETGLGLEIGIDDEEYVRAGCTIGTRENVFSQCDTIVSLKLLQEEDYPLIRNGQMIIGWIHPEVSGRHFWQNQGIEKKLIGVDLDNISPRVYFGNKHVDIPWIPRDFVNRNSFNAGISATMHALMNYGLIPTGNEKIAVLGSGNVSQGAMHTIAKYSSNVRMFYRKTLNEFIDQIESYDIIINGIQIETNANHILTLSDQARMKKGTLIIDAAADGDGAIEGIDYTSFETPITQKNGKFYYCIDNVPTVYYRNASRAISKSFSEWVYTDDVEKFYNLAKEIM